jgi:hypothetical protein
MPKERLGSVTPSRELAHSGEARKEVGRGEEGAGSHAQEKSSGETWGLHGGRSP